MADTDNNTIRLGTPIVTVLTITQAGSQTVISWDATITGFTLQTSATLGPATWNNYLGSTVNNRATNSTAAGNLFYRLRK